MARTKLYTAIYVVLFVLATAQVLVESVFDLEQAYLLAVGIIMVLSFVKAIAVAGAYQHLYWEPRSLSYLILAGLSAAVALTAAAAYSIT